MVGRAREVSAGLSQSCRLGWVLFLVFGSPGATRRWWLHKPCVLQILISPLADGRGWAQAAVKRR